MRLVITAIVAAWTVSAVALTPIYAAPAKNTQAVTQSFNACVTLAKQRGFTTNDIEDTGGARMNSARTFVLRCMQGKQH